MRFVTLKRIKGTSVIRFQIPYKDRVYCLGLSISDEEVLRNDPIQFALMLRAKCEGLQLSMLDHMKEVKGWK